jgi:betaine-homocysteine S-methyltransferase
MIGKEEVLEEINRRALRMARSVASGHDLLVAGDICNTNVYAPDDPASHKAVRAVFAEQATREAEEGVGHVVAETFAFLREAMIALMSKHSRPSAPTGASNRITKSLPGINERDLSGGTAFRR